jgi:hypothetical protein
MQAIYDPTPVTAWVAFCLAKRGWPNNRPTDRAAGILTMTLEIFDEKRIRSVNNTSITRSPTYGYSAAQ